MTSTRTFKICRKYIYRSLETIFKNLQNDTLEKILLPFKKNDNPELKTVSLFRFF